MSIKTSTKEKMLYIAIIIVSLLIAVVLTVGFLTVKNQIENIESEIEMQTLVEEDTELIGSDDSKPLTQEQKQEILKSLSEESGGLTPNEINEQVQNIEQGWTTEPRLTDEEKKRILEQL